MVATGYYTQIPAKLLGQNKISLKRLVFDVIKERSNSFHITNTKSILTGKN